MNQDGYWPYTPEHESSLRLHESLEMLRAEGLDQGVRAPPALAAGVRAAITAWACRSSVPTLPCIRRC